MTHLAEKPLKRWGTVPPSDAFERAFTHGSGLFVECACGRIHFASQDGDWEEGELEAMQAKAKADPVRYLDGEVYTGHIDLGGETWAVGCPCNGMRRFEDLFLACRGDIIDYFQAIAEAAALEAQAKAARISDAILVFRKEELSVQLLEHAQRMQDIFRQLAKPDPGHGDPRNA